MSISSIFAMGGDCDYGYGYHKGGYKGHGGYKGYYRNYYYGNRGLLGLGILG